jgi:hypothetical protein
MSGLQGLAKSPRLKMTLNSLKKEYARTKNSLQRRKIRQLREAFADLVMTPQGANNRHELEAKVKRLMGDVTENRLKMFVNWKLTWWFDESSKELFTFTESERFMRRQTAIMALLANASAGTLGKFSKDLLKTDTTKYTYLDKGVERVVNVPSIFLTEDAKRIARNAVTNAMFGMSTLSLGDAFNGLGTQIFMYKSYPLQQMIHDYKIIRRYIDSNKNPRELFTRVMKESVNAYKRFRSGVSYNEVINSKNVDHEALKVLRFLTTRVAFSIASVAAESVGILGYMLNRPIYKEVSTMLRGGENPLIGLAIRILVNGLLFASVDDDDFEGDMIDIGFDIARLFLPVFLTLPGSIAWQWMKD